jgi:hypothetical protein
MHLAALDRRINPNDQTKLSPRFPFVNAPLGGWAFFPLIMGALEVLWNDARERRHSLFKLQRGQRNWLRCGWIRSARFLSFLNRLIHGYSNP